MNKREWINAILMGQKDVPVAQQWMGFFDKSTAWKLTPEHLRYRPMWLYDAPDYFDCSGMAESELDRMISFNNYHGRCMSFPGRGANLSFGHGGPGEFLVRIVKHDCDELIAEYETGVRVRMKFSPYYYHIYNHPIKTADDLRKLDLPDSADPDRYVGFAANVRYLKSQGEYVSGPLNGFFSGLHYFFMDYEQVLISLIDNGSLIDAMLEQLGNWNLNAARCMVEAGADCVVLCDDLGSKQSLLMSPEQYRRFFKPWHKKLCDLVHQMNARVHLHSHGAITALLDDLAECGFDFINPFDPEEGFCIEELLVRYSHEFVVVGGFPARFWQWSLEEQKEHIRRMVELARKYPRYILMDSGGIPANVRINEYEHMIEFSKQLRAADTVCSCL